MLEPITIEQAPVLRQLLELYCYDFSEHVTARLKPSGRFDFPLGEEWWTRDDHFPFFIRRADELVGFALVRRGSRVSAARDVMDVAEFFVVRGARRCGVGADAARALFQRFPGSWEIRVRDSNAAARQFWLHVSANRLSAPSEPYVRDGVAWQLLRLHSHFASPSRQASDRT